LFNRLLSFSKRLLPSIRKFGQSVIPPRHFSPFGASF
jgi:hypothetical protein